MNEIEKMYENARVKPLCQIPDMFCGIKNVYEDFTAEKQIGLIKWFIHSEHFSPIRFNAQWVVDDIASYINFLWQVLTPEEKQQVKGILE